MSNIRAGGRDTEKGYGVCVCVPKVNLSLSLLLNLRCFENAGMCGWTLAMSLTKACVLPGGMEQHRVRFPWPFSHPASSDEFLLSPRWPLLLKPHLINISLEFLSVFLAYFGKPEGCASSLRQSTNRHVRPYIHIFWFVLSRPRCPRVIHSVPLIKTYVSSRSAFARLPLGEASNFLSLRECQVIIAVAVARS